MMNAGHILALGWLRAPLPELVRRPGLSRTQLLHAADGRRASREGRDGNRSPAEEGGFLNDQQPTVYPYYEAGSNGGAVGKREMHQIQFRPTSIIDHAKKRLQN